MIRFWMSKYKKDSYLVPFFNDIECIEIANKDKNYQINGEDIAEEDHL